MFNLLIIAATLCTRQIDQSSFSNVSMKSLPNKNGIVEWDENIGGEIAAQSKKTQMKMNDVFRLFVIFGDLLTTE